MTVEAKLCKAREHREKGNELFKAGQHKKALLQYARVHAYLHTLIADPSMQQYHQAAGAAKPTLVEKKDIEALQAAAYSNAGICYLKLKQPQQALEQLDKVLAIDPQHGKALCNKGRAWIALNDLEKAESFLREAQGILSDDALIRKELDRLPALHKKQEQKEKATWKRAFGGGSKVGGGESTMSSNSSSASTSPSPRTQQSESVEEPGPQTV